MTLTRRARIYRLGSRTPLPCHHHDAELHTPGVHARRCSTCGAHHTAVVDINSHMTERCGGTPVYSLRWEE